MTGRIWIRAALGGLAAWALALLTVTATVTAYAITLGVRARGEPDPARVERFALLFSPWAMLAFTGLFAFLAGRWACRGERERHGLFERRVGAGFAVGAAAALPPLVRALFLDTGAHPFHLLLFAVAAALGMLGAVTQRRAENLQRPRHTP